MSHNCIDPTSPAISGGPHVDPSPSYEILPGESPTQTAKRLAAENVKLRHELDRIKTAGIAEVAAHNPNVMQFLTDKENIIEGLDEDIKRRADTLVKRNELIADLQKAFNKTRAELISAQNEVLGGREVVEHLRKVLKEVRESRVAESEQHAEEVKRLTAQVESLKNKVINREAQVDIAFNRVQDVQSQLVAARNLLESSNTRFVADLAKLAESARKDSKKKDEVITEQGGQLTKAWAEARELRGFVNDLSEKNRLLKQDLDTVERLLASANDTITQKDKALIQAGALLKSEQARCKMFDDSNRWQAEKLCKLEKEIQQLTTTREVVTIVDRDCRKPVIVIGWTTITLLLNGRDVVLNEANLIPASEITTTRAQALDFCDK